MKKFLLASSIFLFLAVAPTYAMKKHTNCCQKPLIIRIKQKPLIVRFNVITKKPEKTYFTDYKCLECQEPFTSEFGLQYHACRLPLEKIRNTQLFIRFFSLAQTIQKAEIVSYEPHLPKPLSEEVDHTTLLTSNENENNRQLTTQPIFDSSHFFV